MKNHKKPIMKNAKKLDYSMNKCFNSKQNMNTIEISNVNRQNSHTLRLRKSEDYQIALSKKL